MKAYKYIAIALGVVGLLLAGAWFLRNALIERISNPLLAQYGLTVTDVSLDALATRDASISYLELEHVNGAHIAIDDLRLPIRTSRAGLRQYSASRVTIRLPTVVSDEPVDLAGILEQLLAMPQQLANSEITVGEITVPPYPAVRDLRWSLTRDAQKLSALVESFRLTASFRRTSDTNHSLDLSFADAVNTGIGQSIAVDIRRSDAGISLIGSGTLDLHLWSPVIALVGIDAVSAESGSATLHFDAEIANDPNQIPFVNAAITPTSQLKLTVAGLNSSITVESAGTTEISATATDLQWSLKQPQISLKVADNDGNSFDVILADLSCDSGLSCTGDIRVAGDKLVLPFASIERLELAATQHFSVGEDDVRVRIRPDATLELRGIESPDIRLAHLVAQLTDEAQFESVGADWQITARSADIELQHYAVYEGVSFSAPLYLDAISLRHTAGQLKASLGFYAPRSSLDWNGQRISLPGARGLIERRDAKVDAGFETDGLFEEASGEVVHNLETGAGRLNLAGAGLSFASSKLSARVTPWTREWDISAGLVNLDLEAAWRKVKDEWLVSAKASISASDLAGAWEDTVFAGLSTRIEGDFDSNTGFTVEPSTISVALLEIGLPIQNITAAYTLHPAELAVDVDQLRMTAFGGVITADPFSYRTASDSNTLLIHAESIDLAQILSFEEFEAIEISGSVGAELPVTIEGQKLTITGGTLTGVAPGGVIRYLPGIESGQADASGIGFATRALSHFQYDTLTSVVNYATNGDLKLQMRLTGRNPDLEGGRPVILNLGVENNVPQMLRSLQAARAVEEILEKRLKR